MEQILTLLVGGAVGGLGGGKAVKDGNMGNIGNLLAGAVGGVGVGGPAIGALMGSGAEAAGGLDIASLATNLVGGGVAGVIIQIAIGLVVKRFRG